MCMFAKSPFSMRTITFLARVGEEHIRTYDDGKQQPPKKRGAGTERWPQRERRDITHRSEYSIVNHHRRFYFFFSQKLYLYHSQYFWDVPIMKTRPSYFSLINKTNATFCTIKMSLYGQLQFNVQNSNWYGSIGHLSINHDSELSRIN